MCFESHFETNKPELIEFVWFQFLYLPDLFNKQ